MVKFSEILGIPDLFEDHGAVWSVLVEVPFKSAVDLVAAIEWLRSQPQGYGKDAVLDISDAVGRSGGILQLVRVERSAKVSDTEPKPRPVVEHQHLLRVRSGNST